MAGVMSNPDTKVLTIICLGMICADSFDIIKLLETRECVTKKHYCSLTQFYK